MRSWFSRLSPILLLTLAGCASAPAPVAPSIDVLEQNLMDAFEVRADYLIPDAITASRSRYEAFDDLAGQWRVTRLAALFALAHGHAVRAEAEALHLDVLRGHASETVHG